MLTLTLRGHHLLSIPWPGTGGSRSPSSRPGGRNSDSDYYRRKRWSGNSFRPQNADRADPKRYRRGEVEWKLAWLAMGNVLKRRGIHPRFSGPRADEALRSWMSWRPDPERKMTTLAMERLATAQLMWEGELMVELRPDGAFLPLRPADRIRENERHIPELYIWPDGSTLPADRVLHLYLVLEPGQRRGVRLFDVVFDVAEERWGFVKAAGKLGKMVARLGLFRKRHGGVKAVDSDTTEAVEETAEFDWLADSITDIGPQDDIIAPSVSGQPYGPTEMEHLLGGVIAMPYGVSRMSLLGDASDVNYSSARYMSLSDRGVWGIYQDLILEFAQAMYQEWPDLAMYEADMVGWYLPPPDHIDPTKTAAANNILVKMRAKAVQEVILEDDRDPETTMRLIEEWDRRMSDEADTEGD